MSTNSILESRLETHLRNVYDLKRKVENAKKDTMYRRAIEDALVRETLRVEELEAQLENQPEFA